jgi:hypothetical protein
LNSLDDCFVDSIWITCLHFYKHGHLDLSRSCLNQESWSQHRQRVSWENLKIFKKCVLTIQKSWSGSRFLDLASTSMSRPKSLNPDQTIHQDLKISVFLDSLSWSRLRKAWIFAFSCQDLSICSDFSSFSDSKGLNNVEISWQILMRLDKFQQIFVHLYNLDKNLDATKSQLKSLDLKNFTKKNKISCLNLVDNLDT